MLNALQSFALANAHFRLHTDRRTLFRNSYQFIYGLFPPMAMAHCLLSSSFDLTRLREIHSFYIHNNNDTI